MEIKTFVNGIYRANNYLIINGSEAVLIDASDDDYYSVDRFIDERGLSLSAVLFTHGHFDHIGLGKHYIEKGVPTYIHKNDSDMTHTPSNLGYIAKFQVPSFHSTGTLEGGEVLKLAGLEIEVLHTPGHSPGCVCYIVKNEGVIFSGDTLFYRTVGRTDLPASNPAAIKTSIKKLFALEGDYEVFPGHDRATMMSAERKYNPCARV